jgi:hypothetical protein
MKAKLIMDFKDGADGYWSIADKKMGKLKRFLLQ